MNWFKRKYKKSQWFERLLQAEELLKEGYEAGSTFDEPLWFTKVFECGSKSQTTLGYSSDGRKDGAIDYINYFNEKLK